MLNHIYYMMLSLGDSNYNKYQGNPRAINSAIKGLGATQFFHKE